MKKNWKQAVCLGMALGLVVSCPAYAKIGSKAEKLSDEEEQEEVSEDAAEAEETGTADTELAISELPEGIETEYYEDTASKITVGALSFLLPEEWSVVQQEAGIEDGSAVEQALIDTGDDLAEVIIGYNEGSGWDALEDGLADAIEVLEADESVISARTTVLSAGEINGYDSVRFFFTASSEELSWISACAVIQDVNNGTYVICYTVYEGGAYDFISFEGFLDSVDKAGADLPEYLADLDMEKYTEYSSESYTSWSLGWDYENDIVPEYSDIVVDGISVPLGCTLQDLLDAGFVADDYYEDSLDDMVNPDESDFMRLVGPEGAQINVQGKNTQDAAIGFTDCVIYAVSSSYGSTDLSSFSFHGFGAEDIMAIREAFGDPASFSNSEYDSNWTVTWGSYWDGPQVQLTVTDDIITGYSITDYSLID